MDSRSVEFWVQEIYHRIMGVLSPGNAGINVRRTWRTIGRTAERARIAYRNARRRKDEDTQEVNT